MGSIRNFLYLSTLTLCVFFTAGAQGAMAQDFSFYRIDVEGNKRIEASTIVTYSGLATDQVFGADDLNRAYQNIIASGLFESVEVIPNDNLLVIKVSEFPTVNKIEFEGNRLVNDDTLRSAVGLQPRRVFNPDKVDGDRTAIAQLYADQGRLAARITPKIIRRSDNRVDVVFEIFEGGLTEIERIGFVGNRVFSDRRLRRVLSSKQAGFLRTFVRRDTFLADRIQFDKRLLTDFYNARGYIDFEVSDVNAELAEENNAYFLTFFVREGQRFRVGKIALSSDRSDIDLDDFQNAISVETGDIYNPDLMEKNLSRLEARATQLGLDFVRVTPRIERNDIDMTLDIEFTLEQGERVFVERIEIEGNSRTLDQVIRRQFRISEGDPFNSRLIREAAERIRALRLFSSSSVNANEGSSTDEVIVDVEIEEQSTASLQLGASYSGDLGAGLLVQYAERNFLGRGQGLKFTFNNSTDAEQYLLNFTEPYFLNENLSFSLDAYSGSTSSRGANYDSLETSLTPKLGVRLTDKVELDLNIFARERSMTGTYLTGSILQDEIEEKTKRESGFGVGLKYDNKYNKLPGSSRYLIAYNQSFFSTQSGDNRSAKSDLTALAEREIFNEQITVRSIFQAGTIRTNGDPARSIDRYMMNSNVMRGFDYAGVGPRQRHLLGLYDDPLGGNSFSSLKLEVDFPLIVIPEEYGMSGGVFYHAGDIWDLGKRPSGNEQDILYESGRMRETLGAVLYWDTPIGPLRFDFTRALSKQEFDSERRFDLSIATQF
jgi:outer membrane protein insertion porin family